MATTFILPTQNLMKYENKMNYTFGIHSPLCNLIVMSHFLELFDKQWVIPVRNNLCMENSYVCVLTLIGPTLFAIKKSISVIHRSALNISFFLSIDDNLSSQYVILNRKVFFVILHSTQTFVSLAKYPILVFATFFWYFKR